jgi:ring-1,2-phenylacetyl-CoA epoxidase subunit PaaE
MSLARTRWRGAGQPLHPFLRQPRRLSIIFLDALAELKDRYLGRSSCFTASDEDGDVELLNGCSTVRPASNCWRLRARTGRGRRLLHLRPRPDDGRAEAALVERGVAADRIHIERFTAGAPPLLGRTDGGPGERASGLP